MRCQGWLLVVGFWRFSIRKSAALEMKDQLSCERDVKVGGYFSGIYYCIFWILEVILGIYLVSGYLAVFVAILNESAISSKLNCSVLERVFFVSKEYNKNLD